MSTHGIDGKSMAKMLGFEVGEALESVQNSFAIEFVRFEPVKI